MMAWKVVVRSITLMAAVCCLGGFSSVQAQVSVTPPQLSFGQPTGSTSAPPQTVTYVGSGDSVTLGLATFSAHFSSPVGTDKCSGKTLASGQTCTIDVIYTTTTTGTLESGSLSISGAPSVPLTGSGGAIKLFSNTNVETSNPHAHFDPLPSFVFNSTTLALSCPAPNLAAPDANAVTPTGRISSTPDGTGNVLVDNYINLTVTQGDSDPSSTDICRNGLTDSTQEGVIQACFNQNYRSNANGALLHHPTDATTGGIPFLNLQSLDANTPALIQPGSQTAQFDLIDGGGEVANSDLFFVTNCTAAGVTSGGTITGNPLNTNDPTTLAPAFNFNTTQGTHITLATNFVGAATAATTTPTVTDTGITQDQFAALVAGSSAAPAKCLHLLGELDSAGTPLCKAFTITCTDSNGVSQGTNCPQAGTQPLLFEAKMDTQETSFLPSNFLGINGTGPGMVMGTDNWVNEFGVGTPCVTFGSGPLLGHLCPQNSLTEFLGANDPVSGSTPRNVNSTFIPAINVPLPFTTVVITGASGGALTNGWLNATTFGGTANAAFTSNPASYNFADNNGFVPAAIQSLTYGIAPGNGPTPDPTFPVAGDTTNTNAAAGGCNPAPVAAPYLSSASFAGLTDGIYTLHFFATDCASTEELKFSVKPAANGNWADFNSTMIMIDTVAPTISAITFNPSSTGNIFAAGQAVHPLFTCSDDRSGIASCVGSGGVVGDGTGLLNTTGTGTKMFTVTATDNAGNVTMSSVQYQVVGSSELVIFNLTKPTVNAGSSLVFRFGVINFGPAVANNVVFKTTLPGGVTYSGAGFGTVSCVPGSCADIAAPPGSCSVSAGVVTCNIPTVGLITKLTGVLVKITVNVPSGTVAGTIIKDTATVKAANTDPISIDNTATSATQVCSTSGRCPH